MSKQRFTHSITVTEGAWSPRPPATRTGWTHAVSLSQPILRLVLVFGLIVLVLSGGRLEAAAGGLPSKPLTTGYECSEAGLNAAIAAGGTATFTTSPCLIGLTTSKTIAVNLTLDGGTYGGYGLALYSTGLRAFTVHSGVSFTLKNTSLYNATATDSTGGGAILIDGGIVTVDHDQFVNDTAAIGGAIRVINSGTLTVTQSSFLSNKATGGNGGAIDILLGSTAILSTTFTSNTSSGIGGAVSSATPLTITAGTFINNNSFSGGAVVAVNTLKLTGSTFTANHATNGSGGGILTTGKMDVTSSTFSSNTAINGFGGAIATAGVLDVASSTFISNTATASGGAIYQDPGFSMNLDATTFSTNHSDGDGGAVAAQGQLMVNTGSFTDNTAKGNGGSIIALVGPYTIKSSTFLSNTASVGDGGAIYFGNAGSATVDHSTFSGNRSKTYGGALMSTIPLMITSSIFNSNVTGAYGGAIAAPGTPLSVQNTAITGNTAPSGGGIYSVGSLTMTTSSLINNTANMDSGALFTFPGNGTATVVNTTIGQNTGSGIASYGAGVQVSNSTIVNNNTALYAITSTLHVKNSIVSGACAGNGSITSQGYNLGTDNTCGLTRATDRVMGYAALKLGALVTADNGTTVYPLLAGSPGRDTADPLTCPSTDQRGIARPQGSGCDTGAYEAAAGVSLTPATKTLIGIPNQTVQTTLILKNVGPAVPDAYAITLEGQAWTTTVQPAATALLAVGDSITLTVRVTIPPDAHPGQSSTIMVKATSQAHPEQTAAAQITTIVSTVSANQIALPVVMRSSRSGW